MSVFNPIADLTPNLNGYSGVSTFRFWCQKILPIVYDDSLSYYELLNKVVVYLNHVIEDLGVTEDNVEILRDKFVELLEQVDARLSDLGLEKFVDEKIEEMALNGYFLNLITEYFGLGGFINLKLFAPGGELTASHFQDALDAAKAYGSSYYIPAGNYYDMHCEIDWDCELWIDRGAVFEKETLGADSHTTFLFHDCRFKLNGGTFFNGDAEEASSSLVTVGRNYSDARGVYGVSGFILADNCHDSEIVNVNVTHSLTAGCITLSNCISTSVKNCNFNNILFYGILISQRRKENNPDAFSGNISVEGCVFKNIRAPYAEETASGETNYPTAFCYAVYTGVAGNLKTDTEAALPNVLARAIKPLNNLRYVNNYVDGSDDCGLDTHGASNVYIGNNTVLNTVCAITAYNDNNREPRPEGWRMENIIIENNYCESEKENSSLTHWPHPFIYLGPSSIGKVTGGHVWSKTQKIDSFTNCRVYNNTFITKNDYGRGSTTIKGWLYLSDGGTGITIEQNYFKTIRPSNWSATSRYALTITRQINVIFRNNTCSPDQQELVRFYGCYGECRYNTGFKFYAASESVWYMEGITYNIDSELVPRIAKLGESFWMNTSPCIVTSYGYKWCHRVADTTDPSGFRFDVPAYSRKVRIIGTRLFLEDENGAYGVVTLIPNLSVSVTRDGETSAKNVVVINQVSDNEFVLNTAPSYTGDTGTQDHYYTLALRTCTIKSLDNIPA